MDKYEGRVTGTGWESFLKASGDRRIRKGDTVRIEGDDAVYRLDTGRLAELNQNSQTYKGNFKSFEDAIQDNKWHADYKVTW